MARRKVDPEKKTKLTGKQQRFVEEYCKDFNATKAATRSGYSIHTAGSIGHENLTKPEIMAAVNERVEGLVMSSNEALLLLTDLARGSFKPFLRVAEKGMDQVVVLDLYSDDAQANVHLIKKIKQTRQVLAEDLINITTEIELHDAKDAIVKVLQLHGKLIEKKQIDHTTGGERIEQTTIVFGKGSNVSDSPK